MIYFKFTGTRLLNITMSILTGAKFQWTSLDIHWKIFQVHGTSSFNSEAEKV